jgi:hypothetical protein
MLFRLDKRIESPEVGVRDARTLRLRVAGRPTRDQQTRAPGAPDLGNAPMLSNTTRSSFDDDLLASEDTAVRGAGEVQ